MNSPDIFTPVFLNLNAVDQGAKGVQTKSALRVKELSERDRRRLLLHFLALGENDRRLRFGVFMSDELITRYVQHIDFHRDVLFGVYDENLMLSGVGHLAFAPRDALPAIAAATIKERVAELGISVLEAARGKGIGSRLFERAAMHCRNEDIDTLHMHCLGSNQTMIHIAHKAGIEIQRDCGEADAYLKLLPANPGTMLREAIEEQAASFDYVLKANACTAARWLGNISRVKRG